jgi:FkbM family methyltransferase
METVFDVEANADWFTWQFGCVFTEARFHLFEPIPAQLDPVATTVANHPAENLFDRLTLNALAVGDETGQVQMTALPDVTVNHVIVRGGPPPPDSWPRRMIDIARGDDCCAARGVTHIDFLKIDAEGYDMDVLRALRAMLSAGNVDFVQVEASMARDNTMHVHIALFIDYLGQAGFRMFRIINQGSGKRLPYLTRADVVFIREKHAKALAGS